jgi:hypothetical protein
MWPEFIRIGDSFWRVPEAARRSRTLQIMVTPPQPPPGPQVTLGVGPGWKFAAVADGGARFDLEEVSGHVHVESPAAPGLYVGPLAVGGASLHQDAPAAPGPEPTTH